MKTLLFIVQLIPALIEIIKAVESLLPEGGKGSEKLDLVRSILVRTYEGVTEYMPTIENVIAVIVEFANKTGVFKKHV